MTHWKVRPAVVVALAAISMGPVAVACGNGDDAIRKPPRQPRHDDDDDTEFDPRRRPRRPPPLRPSFRGLRRSRTRRRSPVRLRFPTRPRFPARPPFRVRHRPAIPAIPAIPDPRQLGNEELERERATLDPACGGGRTDRRRDRSAGSRVGDRRRTNRSAAETPSQPICPRPRPRTTRTWPTCRSSIRSCRIRITSRNARRPSRVGGSWSIPLAVVACAGGCRFRSGAANADCFVSHTSGQS